MDSVITTVGEAVLTENIAQEVSFQTSEARDKRLTPATKSPSRGAKKPTKSKKGVLAKKSRSAYPLTPALTLELIQTHAAGWQQHGHAISIENLHSKGRKAFAIVYNDAWWCKHCGSAIEGDPHPTCPLCNEAYADSQAQPTI